MTDDAAQLRAALSNHRRDPAARSEVIDLCKRLERTPEHAFTAVRDEITGPIVDSLYDPDEIVRKELSNGIVFDFYYRSRIARDFVMSDPERPDHVWEPQTTKLLLFLSEGAVDVLVGGAYFGDHAILLANQLRDSGGTCHAFEPDSAQAAMLRHNAEVNRLSNIRVSTLGLWSDVATRLRLSGHDALASSTPVAATDVSQVDGSFATTTIDAYLAQNGIDRLQLIMLDIEGGELEVLRGAERQLALPPGIAPDIVFEIHRSYVDWSDGLENTDVVRHLARFGYTVFAIRDFQSNYDLSGYPIELVPIATAFLDGPPHGFNMVAVKERARISGERFRIVPGVSPKLLMHRDPALHHPVGGLRND